MRTARRRAAATAWTVHDPMFMLRCLVAGVFLTAALGKLLHYQGLVLSLLRLGWLPDDLIRPAADVLLAGELAVGFLLLANHAVPTAGGIGALMAAGFMATTGVKLAHGVSSDCECFGLFLRLSPQVTLGVDLLLFAACITLCSL